MLFVRWEWLLHKGHRSAHPNALDRHENFKSVIYRPDAGGS